MQKSNRRSFLKTATVAGIAAGAIALNEVSPRIWREETYFKPNPSYWAQSQPPPNPALNEDLEADVAIIGGGFTGLSAAHFIRKNSPSKSVVVLEAMGCGHGASGRNGAMLLNLTADRYMNFSSDPAMDRKIYDLTTENIRFLGSLPQATGIDFEIDTNGSLQVLNTAADVADCKAYVEKARALGFPVEFWTKDQTAAAVGTSVYEGAFYDPQSGQLHPMKLVHALKVLAESSGAKIYENTPVMQVQDGPTHHLTTLAGHTVRAKSLVLATNAYTSRLGYFRNRIVPIHNYVGITPQLPAAAIEQIGWRRRMPFSDSRTLVHYLGLTRDNRIHIGGGTSDYSFNDGLRDLPNEAERFAGLQRELVRIFPALAGTTFETTWSGLVDCSLDFSPSVGCTGKFQNIFYGLGYSGHGVNLTSLFGRIIADLERGAGEIWQHFPFVNHTLIYLPNEPFRWLGTQASMAYYRLTK
ncbi:MAG TPA: FAD-dependent oxidoreductase [Candidatus Acidoferrales bacterium]